MFAKLNPKQGCAVLALAVMVTIWLILILPHHP